jgi:hypothetical protein
LAGLYEYQYYCRRDYPDVVRKVAQLVHCVGKGEYAVFAGLLGLPKDAAIKGWNHEMIEGLGFKFQPGDGLTRDDIERQLGILCQMAKQIGMKVLNMGKLEQLASGRRVDTCTCRLSTVRTSHRSRSSCSASS